MQPSDYTLTLAVRDVPGMLIRVAQVFVRRGCNIRSIHVEPAEGSRWSTMTIVTVNVGRIELIVRQLEKLVDVRSVRVNS